MIFESWAVSWGLLYSGDFIGIWRKCLYRPRACNGSTRSFSKVQHFTRSHLSLKSDGTLRINGMPCRLKIMPRFVTILIKDYAYLAAQNLVPCSTFYSNTQLCYFPAYAVLHAPKSSIIQMCWCLWFLVIAIITRLKHDFVLVTKRILMTRYNKMFLTLILWKPIPFRNVWLDICIRSHEKKKEVDIIIA